MRTRSGRTSFIALVTQTQPLHHPGTKVFEGQVGTTDQRQRQLNGSRFLEVQADRHLVGVDLLEAAGRLAIHGVRAPGDVEPSRTLYLDHLGPEFSQHQTGKGPRRVHGEIGDPDAGKGTRGFLRSRTIARCHRPTFTSAVQCSV